MFSKTVLRSIDANRTIKNKIVQSISISRSRLHISVTDLTNPMQSYYRGLHPEIKTPIVPAEPSIDNPVPSASKLELRVI